MHIHILGICGTFMGSLALLARDLGHTVTGSDANVYPPMSTQLEKSGIEIMQGYSSSHLGADNPEEVTHPVPDLVVVGNAMKRDIDAVEYMLDQGIAYVSGPQFLSEQILQSRHVLAVSGTHGKTTTTTMLAWVLQYNHIDTGFLIGGVPVVNSEDARLQKVFSYSSYLGKDSDKDSKLGYFVIEADEYDSAFFDKRSKFVHYRPRTAILNNLEFDHADIFPDLNAIQTQFHHMIRMIPKSGRIIMPAGIPSLEETIDKGCWTPIWRTEEVSEFETDSAALQESQTQWKVKLLAEDGSKFAVQYIDDNDVVHIGEVSWDMSGLHNVYNGLMSIAAAVDIGINVLGACEALSQFAGIKRRMELIATIRDIAIFDDFAHHPTAITTTLDGAKKKLMGDKPESKLWAIIEPRSNTMKLGIHRNHLADSASLADNVLWYEPEALEWGLKQVIEQSEVSNKQIVMNSTDLIIQHVCENVKSNDVIIIMSNGGFEGIHHKLKEALKKPFL